MENWRVMLISAFNYVIVEVVAEIGNKGNKTQVESVQLRKTLDVNLLVFSFPLGIGLIKYGGLG